MTGGNRSRLAGIVGAGVVALLALSGCQDQGRGPPLPDQPLSATPGACPRIYDPVCGARGGDQRTFPNSCEASASGYDILYGGQCQEGGPGPGGGIGGGQQPGQGDLYGPPGQGDLQGVPGQGGGQDSGQMCPMIYKPVCGRSGSDTRTFPNACKAQSAGYQVLYESECLGNAGNGGGQGGNRGAGGGSNAAGQAPGGGSAGADLASPGSSGGQSCSRAFVPVCGKKGSETKTFINACMAQSNGYRVASEGRCQ